MLSNRWRTCLTISRAVAVTVAVNEDGARVSYRCAIGPSTVANGVATGPSESIRLRLTLLDRLPVQPRADRGLRGVKLVIADDHKGLGAAAGRVFNGEPFRAIGRSVTVS